MQTVSVRRPPVNCMSPMKKALVGLLKSKGWFVEYFIMIRPYLTSLSTTRCIMMTRIRRVTKFMN